MFTLSTTPLLRSKPQAWHCVYSGCQGIVITKAMTPQTDWRRMLPGQANDTNSGRCLQGRAFIRSNIIAQWEHEWTSASTCGHLRKIDQSLPSAYTRKFYGNLARGQAYLLTQLRTRHNWLSTYAKLFGFRDDDQCVCGAQETVTHVLIDCPTLKDLRRELRQKVGCAFSSVSSAA